MKSVLVADDSEAIQKTLDMHLSEEGYAVKTAGDGDAALDIVREDKPDVVILDIRMPGKDGLTALKEMHAMDATMPVIMVTAVEDMQTTIEAIKLGAHDYINKPIDLNRLEVTIRRALEARELQERLGSMVKESQEEFQVDNIIGADEGIREIFKTIGSLSGTKTTVLIRGESGTGKELVARAIHYNGPTASEPFVAVNCTALTETILESELFGHEKGSFTGAIADKKGKFELAGNGTLFLDEVGEMSPMLQVKLLRVLQERAFERVGGHQTIKCNARVIAATNADLAAKVQDGSFREDLYYRLKVVELVIPPLRQRRDDIPALCQHLITKIAQELHKPVRIIPPEVLDRFVEYDWPGNVRELENMLTRAMVLAKGTVLTEDLFPGLEQSTPEFSSPPLQQLTKSLADVERDHIKLILDSLNWNKRKAVQILGISRPTLDKKIQVYNLKKPSAPAQPGSRPTETTAE